MKKSIIHKRSHAIGLITSLLLAFMMQSMMAQTKRAFLVGISDYPQSTENSWSNIHGANDVEIISKTLKTQSFKISSLTNKAATAKNIRKGLNDFIATCKLGDMVYLHFSCHGQPFEDLDGDEEDGWDEAIIPYDACMVFQKGKYEGANHIIDDELHTYFQKLMSKVGSSGLVCVVIDACHAGNTYMGDEEDEEETFLRGTKKGFSPNAKDYHPRINAKGRFQIIKKAGQGDVIVLEACRSYQSNYEIKQTGKYYGSLSYYVSQILAKQQLPRSMDWVNEVKSLMSSDRRLTRQNMVYETTLK